MQWTVTYALAQDITIRLPVQDYSNIGVSLICNGNKLIRIQHEVDTQDSATVDEAIAHSEEQLRVFWELLEYKAGRSLAIGRRSAEQIHPAPGTASPRTSDISKPAVVAIADEPVAMPNPNKLQTISSNDRLAVWLRLANEARKATVDADALRDYYMIWEDLPSSLKPSTTATIANEIRLIRNFVSHGRKLHDCNVVGFITQKLGKPVSQPVDQYDPTDTAQQQLIRSYREIARQLIEGELNKLL